MNKYVELYRNLSDEKKKSLQNTLWFIGGFIIYSMVFLYLQNHVSVLKNQVEKKQKDIIWLQNRVSLIKQIQQENQNVKRKPYTIADVEGMMKEMSLNTYVTIFRENSDDGGIEVNMDKVPFNLVYSWLLELSKRTNFELNNLSMKNRGDGQIDVDLEIKLFPTEQATLDSSIQTLSFEERMLKLGSVDI